MNVWPAMECVFKKVLVYRYLYHACMFKIWSDYFPKTTDFFFNFVGMVFFLCSYCIVTSLIWSFH